MSALTGMRGQFYKDRLYDASGTIANASAAQLVIPLAQCRSSLYLQNNSTGAAMTFEFGPARATATVSAGGTIASVTVSNPGFGYSLPPTISFESGALGASGSPISSPTYTQQGLPDYASPSNVAQAHCVMSGTAPNQSVGSIVLDNPGSGYAYPPNVILTNHPNDPFGCALPGTTLTGITLAAGAAPFVINGSVCPTDQISVFCTQAGATYACKYTSI